MIAILAHWLLFLVLVLACSACLFFVWCLCYVAAEPLARIPPRHVERHVPHGNGIPESTRVQERQWLKELYDELDADAVFIRR